MLNEIKSVSSMVESDNTFLGILCFHFKVLCLRFFFAITTKKASTVLNLEKPFEVIIAMVKDII